MNVFSIRLLGIVALALFGVLMADHAAADDGVRPPKPATRFWQVTLENDLFFATDRYYTNGVQIAMGGHEDKPNFALAAVERLLCGKDVCGADNRVATVSKYGQLMYTPVDITVVAAQPNDRPWGGYLYYTTESTYVHPLTSSTTTIGLQLGLVGPLALTEQTQKFIHTTFTGRPPRGWDNQMDTEPGMGASYWREWRLAHRRSELAEGALWIGGGGMAGNVFTYGQASVKVAFGRNIPVVVSPSQIGTRALPARRGTKRPRDDAAGGGGIGTLALGEIEGPDVVGGPDRFDGCLWLFSSCYMFAEAGARGVVRNLFLDGNTFRGNNGNIDKRFFVVDLTVGFRLRFGPQLASWADGFYLDFSRTQRSSEFSSPLGDAAIQRFAAITLGREF